MTAPPCTAQTKAMPNIPTSREKQLDYIRRVLQLTGWTQSVLARRAGLDPSTLSRFLSNEREGHALRGNSILRIGEVTGISPNADAPAPPRSGLAEGEASPLAPDEGSEAQSLLASLRERHANVDAWVLTTRALELAGYLPGDIVFVSLGETPLAGDVVCAQAYDWATSRAETAFRLFQPPFLVTATLDPKLQKPWSAEESQTAIKGVVVGMLRNRRT